MAGNVATIASTGFAYSVMRAPPPPSSNAVLWCYFGQDLAHSQNLVGAPIANVGSGPVYPPCNSYASLTAGSAGLTTSIVDPGGSFTLLFACRTQGSTGLTNCISNYYTTPSNLGVRTRLGSGAGLDAFISGAGVSLPAMLIPAGAMGFKFYAVTRQAGVDASMYDCTDNISSTAPGTPTRTLSGQPWMIGQNPAGTDQSTQLDIAFAGILQSYADAAGVAWLYQSVRETLALRGVIV